MKVNSTSLPSANSYFPTFGQIILPYMKVNSYFPTFDQLLLPYIPPTRTSLHESQLDFPTFGQLVLPYIRSTRTSLHESQLVFPYNRPTLASLHSANSYFTT